MPSKIDQLNVDFAQGFLAERGIESLADRQVRGHDGEFVSLAEALVSCGHVSSQIDATIELARDLGGENIDILPHVAKQIDKMREEPPVNRITATHLAEKK